MKVKLQCTETDWHELAKAVDSARAGTETIRIDKGALDRLMKDHSNLLHVHNNQWEQTK